jgi:hypothetical protein
VSTTTKAEPDLGDVYRAAPTTTPLGDAHGDNGRPVGVVELAVHVVHTLTRTTPPSGVRSQARLTGDPKARALPGRSLDRLQATTIRYAKFATNECAYLGPLDDDECEALLNFWRMTKMLGRA